MSKSRTLFRLASDKQRSGVSYWVAFFWDPNLQKTVKRSTGIEDDGTKRSQRQAEAVAHSALAQGLFDEKPKELTLNEFGKDFWKWGVSAYLEGRLLRDEKALSPEYAAGMDGQLRLHVLPHIGNLKLKDITPDVLDDLVTKLLKKKLSKQTVKHVLCSLSPVMKQAVRKRLIQYDPIPSMIEFAVRGKQRDAFTLKEARELLHKDKVLTYWQVEGAKYHPTYNPFMHYALSLLTATTGARIGTVLCLRREDIVLIDDAPDPYYEVSLLKSFGRIQGVKPGSKTGNGTIVPIAKDILEWVLPHLPTTGYLFASRWGVHKIIAHRTAMRAFETAMVKAGISLEEQKRRLLGFHSWRHTFETQARSKGLSREIRSGFTEHKSEKIADRYAHMRAADLIAALPVQRLITSEG